MYSLYKFLTLSYFWQLSLGIPSYGHGFLVNSSSALDASGQLVLNPPFSGTPKGDKWDAGPGGLCALSGRYDIV